MVKGAMIGCGFFAENQFRAWSEMDGVDIVAVCDLNRDRLEHFKQQFSVHNCYEDALKMLSETDLDFVDIAAPSSSHGVLVTMAAQKGINIICQKPFASSLSEAERLIALCDAQGVCLTIHENFRWQSAIRKVIETVRDGRIGNPFFGRISYRNGFDVFRQQPYLAHSERFIVEDLGIHILDVARALFGNVESLFCQTSRINEHILGEDVATIMLQHQQGVTAVVDCSYATTLSDDPFPQTLIDIDGTHGSLRLRADYQLEIHDGAGCQIVDVAPNPPQWSEPPWSLIQDSVLRFQVDWLACVQVGRIPETHGHDNFQTLKLVEAAYQSARSGAAVTPDTMRFG